MDRYSHLDPVVVGCECKDITCGTIKLDMDDDHLYMDVMVRGDWSWWVRLKEAWNWLLGRYVVSSLLTSRVSLINALEKLGGKGPQVNLTSTLESVGLQCMGLFVSKFESRLPLNHVPLQYGKYPGVAFLMPNNIDSPVLSNPEVVEIISGEWVARLDGWGDERNGPYCKGICFTSTDKVETFLVKWFLNYYEVHAAWYRPEHGTGFDAIIVTKVGDDRYFVALLDVRSKARGTFYFDPSEEILELDDNRTFLSQIAEKLREEKVQGWWQQQQH